MVNLIVRKRPNLIDDFFEDFVPFFNTGSSVMKTDIREDENSYFLDIDLPGFKKEEIKLSYKDEYLTIEAKRETKTEEIHYLRRERNDDEVSRRYHVGLISEDKIGAVFTNGVLTVSIPKKNEAETKKYITIE